MAAMGVFDGSLPFDLARAIASFIHFSSVERVTTASLLPSGTRRSNAFKFHPFLIHRSQ